MTSDPCSLPCDQNCHILHVKMAAPGSSDVVDTHELLLCGDFSLFPRKKSVFHVRLTQKTLSYVRKGADNKDEKVISTSDIIGCHCRHGAEGNTSSYFTVYAYPFRKKMFSGKQLRQRQSVTFDVQDFDTYQENRKVSQRWRRVILTLAQGVRVTKEVLDTCAPVSYGKLKILVNPHSGPGKAMQIFQKQVAPMLEEAEMKYDLITTEYAGHAKDIAGNMDLSECYAIVIMSGDGLVYEVINGLMSRSDWDKAVKMPVGVLPGGSGNALCCSINYSAGEPFNENFVLHSAFVLIKHKVLPMDLVFVETQKEKVHSFLSTAIGFIADVDYESEKYRNLGNARFTVGALKRIMGLKTYRMKISYLPIAEYEQTQSNGLRSKDRKVTKLRRFSLSSNSNSLNRIDSEEVSGTTSMENMVEKQRTYSVPETGTEALTLEGEENMSVKARTQSEAGYTSPGTEVQREEQIFSSLFQEDQGHDSETEAAGETLRSSVPNAVNCTSTDSLYSDDNSVIHETFTAVKRADAPVPTPLMPPLNVPVPDTWTTIEDEFISVCAVYQSHLNNDTMVAPQGRLSEGFIYLLMLRKAGVSRSTLVNLFMSMAEGAHVDSPYVEVVKALAFRMEPLSEEGVIMVDGELVEFGPIQGHILPNLARIMAIR